MRCVDEGQVRKGLREVAQLPSCDRIVFFCEQTDVVAIGQEPIEESLCFFDAALQNIVVGQPKAASEEGAFTGGEPSTVALVS
jgi:hypothetical protein